MYYLLFYDYVENIVERRAPYREVHLKLAREWLDRGEFVMGGTYVDPVDGAVLLFQVKDRAAVEEFVKADPYVANGLVTAWRIRPWNVVIGGAPDAKR
jgi:uncharacterized protein